MSAVQLFVHPNPKEDQPKVWGYVADNPAHARTVFFGKIGSEYTLKSGVQKDPTSTQHEKMQKGYIPIGKASSFEEVQLLADVYNRAAESGRFVYDGSDSDERLRAAALQRLGFAVLMSDAASAPSRPPKTNPFLEKVKAEAETAQGPVPRDFILTF